MTVSAVILAAGAGTRLGGVAKALLVGSDGRTFLARVVDTAREVGLDGAVVVVGQPFAAEVGSEADRLGATVIVNPAPERGMASSVACGFAALANLTARATGGGTVGAGAMFAGVNAAWLWPVDVPGVQTATLHALVAARASHDAARPMYRGRGGHPPLVGHSLFARLASCTDAPGGARSVLASADTIDVAVDDPGCARDIDTPRDLEAL